MIKGTVISFCFILFFVNSVQAKLDVVHPASKQLRVNSSTVYFAGSTDENSNVLINSIPVKLWNKNFFVQVIPLDYGKNIIKLISNKNGKIEEMIYTITRNKTEACSSISPKYIKKNDDDILYTKTVKDRAVIREKPSSSSKRYIDLPVNVVLYLEGRQGDYYKIQSNCADEFWIHKSNIKEPVIMKSKMLPKVQPPKFYSDKYYNYAEFSITYPVLYNVKQTGNILELTLYGVETPDKDRGINPNYKYTFEYDGTILGYDCYYKGNTLVYRAAKLPDEIDEKNPLAGLNIFVDAGHGGSDKGAVGATRVNEKDINLAISKYLSEYLKEAGANVILSRTEDTKTGLYERVETAKENNALISISIHCNSLPYGKNPYEKHGTEVHYYNENAKLLAEIINTNLANDLSLKAGGAIKSSFALNRATNPVSVLIETAYMMYPEEYILLQNAQFQKNIAKSIKNSIEKYIINILLKTK